MYIYGISLSLSPQCRGVTMYIYIYVYQYPGLMMSNVRYICYARYASVVNLFVQTW